MSRLLILLVAISIPRACSIVVVNTWPFVNATAAAWAALKNGSTAVDAVVTGCTVCEVEQCDGTVGYGGSPDTNGETTLDAAIMDGNTMDVGSVGCLRRVKQAISVAHAVMLYTEHTLMAGELASAFAVEMGFEEVNLTTARSAAIYDAWLANDCQPNYWQNVLPNPTTSCGPYSPATVEESYMRQHVPNAEICRENHDTIGMLAIDADNNIAAGTSTNGANHKVAGRVGDSPIIGAGYYAQNGIGACAATGDGDTMMRLVPCYQAVESMRLGMTPKEAANDAISRIAVYYPTFQGAIVVMNAEGVAAGAGFGWTFAYSIANSTTDGVLVISVPPVTPGEIEAARLKYAPHRKPQ